MAELEADAWDHFHEHLLPRTFPDGIARYEHVAPDLLITGALDFVVGPMRPLFDDMVSPPRAASTGATPHRRVATHR